MENKQCQLAGWERKGHAFLPRKDIKVTTQHVRRRDDVKLAELEEAQ